MDTNEALLAEINAQVAGFIVADIKAWLDRRRERGIT